MSEIEGLEDMLAELRTRPGMWRVLATVEDEVIASLAVEAFGNTAADRDGDEQYDFAHREIEPGKWQIYARYEDPDAVETADVWDLDYARNRRPN